MCLIQAGRSLSSPRRRYLHLLYPFRCLHGAIQPNSHDHGLLFRCLSQRDLQNARRLLDTTPHRSDPASPVIRWTSLLSRYAQRGHIEEARALFDIMPHRNIVTWNAMLSAYAGSGRLHDARHLFDAMPERNVVSWTSMLCALLRAGRTREAAGLFAAMPERNVVSWNAMVAGLARNGELAEARRVFDAAPERDRASWNAMIAAYAERSTMGEARRLFDRMGADADVVTWTTMVAGYCRAGDVAEAYGLFREMTPVTRNVVTWTAMIGGLVWNRHYGDALQLFLEMNQTARVAPNSETLISLVYACTGLGIPRLGKQVHAQLQVHGMDGGDPDGRLAKGLIQMYSRFGTMEWAHRVFLQNPVSSEDTTCWNSMVRGYAQMGRLEEARCLFDRTPFPDGITWTTMIGAYFDDGNVSEACRLFDRMPYRDDVAWTAVISGLVQNEMAEEAVGVFSEMRAADGGQPTDHAFAALLGAAGSTARLEMGEQLHGLLARTRSEPDTAVGNALVSMYAKCGDVGGARRAFAAMASRDVVSWNAMIVGLSHHGLAREALARFNAMPVEPNGVTFLGALTACTHAGMVDRGREIFESMAVAPGVEHYACMVHLLGRAGRAAEAERLLAGLPFEPGVALWGALLGACGSVVGGGEDGEAWTVGERAARRVIEMDPLNAAAHVWLCRLYAVGERRREEGEVRREMGWKGVTKVPGMSWVVVRGRTHVFVCGDRSHPECEEIDAALNLFFSLAKKHRIENTCYGGSLHT